MTKGEKNKDISDISTTGEKNKDSENTIKGKNLTQGERYDKGRGSIKFLSTQVGGASS